MLLRIKEGDQEAIGSDGRLNRARTLRSLQEFAGESGIATLTDPEGVDHRFTLDLWKDRDPDKTLLVVSFLKFNPEIYGDGKLLPLPGREPYEL